MRLPPGAVSVGDVRRSLGVPVTNPVQTHRGRPPPARGDTCRHPRGSGKSVSPGGRRAVAWLGHADPPVRRPRHPRPAQPAAVPGVGRPAPVAHAARRDLLRCRCGWSARRCSRRRCSRAIDEGIIAGDNGRLLLWGGVLLVLGAVGAVDRRAATPVRGDQLAGAAFRAHPAGRLQDGRHRPGAAPDHAHRRGRRDRRLRRDAGRWPVRRLRPVRRRHRQLRRRRASCCSPPRTPLGLVVLVGVPLLVGTLSLHRPSAAAPPGPAARGVRPADHASAPTPSPACACCAASAASRPSCAATRSSPSGCASSAPGWPASRPPSTRPRCCCPASSSCSSPGSAPASPSTAGSPPGELVAFYGYSAFLVIPLRTATEFADRATRAHIGARKIIRVLAVEPDHHGRPAVPARRAGRRGARSTDPRQRRHRGAGPADRRGLGAPGGVRRPGRPAGPVRPGRARRSSWDGVPLADLPLAARSAAASSSARPTPGCSPACCARSSTRRASHDDDALLEALVGRERRGRPRGAARGAGQRGRGARPVLLRRPAPAPRPGPGAADRRRDAGAGRAHERGGRPHRVPDRRAPGAGPRVAGPPWS